MDARKAEGGLLLGSACCGCWLRCGWKRGKHLYFVTFLMLLEGL